MYCFNCKQIGKEYLKNKDISFKESETQLKMCERCCFIKNTNKLQEKTYESVRVKYVENFWKKNYLKNNFR